MWSLASTVLGVSMVALVVIPGKATGQLIQATCTIAKNSGVGPVEGTIKLSQTTGRNLSIGINLSGFNSTSTTTLHGFHVHMFGNLGQQCNAAGGHYNPTNVHHGGPQDLIRHVGDWGNIQVKTDGTISTTITDNVAQLSGSQSIIGLAIVAHAMEDDLGRGNYSDSLTTGHAGARLGCCIIVSRANAPTAIALYTLILGLLLTATVAYNDHFDL